MRAFVLCLILISFSSSFAFGQKSSDPVIGITPSYEDTINCGNGENSIALTESGNLFRFAPISYLGPRVWSQIGNIWEMTGETSSGSFCGIARWGSPEISLLAITKDGHSFYRSGNEWFYEGQISDLSGRVQDGEFATLVKGARACAITASGELYERTTIVGDWYFSGSIEEDTGVVAGETESFNGFKAMFR